MRLFTHNLLQCCAKGCNRALAFPLRFRPGVQLERAEADANPDFLRGMAHRLDWPALAATAADLGLEALPAEMPEQLESLPDDDDLLRRLHTVLMETEVVQGEMECRGCGHVYRITDKIPNMLLSEHEV